jgi:proteasome activator subunit 4
MRPCNTNFIPKAFDGFRRRCLPKLYKALEPGVDDDRMKGALWTLDTSVFGESLL